MSRVRPARDAHRGATRPLTLALALLLAACGGPAHAQEAAPEPRRVPGIGHVSFAISVGPIPSRAAEAIGLDDNGEGFVIAHNHIEGHPDGIFLTALPAHSHRRAVSDTTEVLDAAEAFLGAFNRLEWEPFHASFQPDATVFQPFGEPFRNDGREQVAAFFRSFFDRVREDRDGPPYLDIEPEDLRIDPVGEAAVVTFHLPGEEQVGRRTLVFGRDTPDAPWRIAHLHASTLERPGAGGEGAGAPSRKLQAGQAERYAGRYTLSQPETGGMTLTFRVGDDRLEVKVGGDVGELSYLGGHVFRAPPGFLFVFDVDGDGRATGVTGLPRDLDRPVEVYRRIEEAG